MTRTDGGVPATKFRGWIRERGAAAARAIHLRDHATTMAATLNLDWIRDAEPQTVKEAWAASEIDVARIPDSDGAGQVHMWWSVSNRTDRFVAFGLAIALSLPRITPRKLRGALLWLAIRPTRRWVAAFFALIFVAWLYAVVA
jgi:hypothetical protein